MDYTIHRLLWLKGKVFWSLKRLRLETPSQWVCVCGGSNPGRKRFLIILSLGLFIKLQIFLLSSAFLSQHSTRIHIYFAILSKADLSWLVMINPWFNCLNYYILVLSFWTFLAMYTELLRRRLRVEPNWAWAPRSSRVWGRSDRRWG